MPTGIEWAYETFEILKIYVLWSNVKYPNTINLCIKFRCPSYLSRSASELEEISEKIFHLLLYQNK